jgi:hypothetical protein
MVNGTDAALLERLRESPDEQFDLIVTVTGDPRCYERHMQCFSLKVKGAFSLTQKLALAGSARAFLDLSQASWVVKMEEDKPVQAAG